MPEIAFIMGKSSSGKDSIFKELSSDKDLKLKTVIPYTTRPKRDGEQDGVEYHFVDEEKVKELYKAGKVIELRCYQTVHGPWKYFTADDGQIDLSNGRYLVIGTLEAYEKYCQYFGKEHLLPIYIEVDDDERILRAINREKQQKSPDYKEMCRRFLADCEDFSEENISRNHITKRYYNNSDLQDCIDDIKADLKKYL